MAKKPATPTAPALNMMLLSAIGNANAAGQFIYVSKDEGTPFLQHNPPLIDVNPQMADPNDATKIAAAITEAGKAMLAAPQAASTAAPVASPFAIIDGAVLPEAKKRFGGGGAPTVYPFETMQIGQSFFVPVSEKHPDPLKTLGSTVSSINHKYSTETGETRTKKVAKRGDDKKPVLDVAGNKVMVDTVVKLRKPERKFTIRAVEAGKTYGAFTAPANGVLIARVNLPA